MGLEVAKNNHGKTTYPILKMSVLKTWVTQIQKFSLKIEHNINL
jgi:hypothetical protein